MRLSKQGLELIKKWEQLRLTAYPDGVGVYTIGYGHTKNVSSGMTISEQTANMYLKQDVTEFEYQVNKYTAGIKLTQSQFDALVSLVFNVGPGSIFTKDYGNSFGKGSTLYNHLKNNRFNEAGEHFTDFVKSGGVKVQGLLNRRLDEQKLFFSDMEGVKKKVTTFCCPHCSRSLSIS